MVQLTSMQGIDKKASQDGGMDDFSVGLGRRRGAEGGNRILDSFNSIMLIIIFI